MSRWLRQSSWPLPTLGDQGPSSGPWNRETGLDLGRALGIADSRVGTGERACAHPGLPGHSRQRIKRSHGNLWHALVLGFIIPVVTSCATGRGASVPRDAPPELRERYAGKSLECAGKLRENAIYASLGAAAASASATTISSYAATQSATLGSGTLLALSCTSCTLGLTGFGLSIYSLLATLDAAGKDQMAGRILSDEADEACVIGDLPVPPEVPPPAPAPVAAPN